MLLSHFLKTCFLMLRKYYLQVRARDCKLEHVAALSYYDRFILWHRETFSPNFSLASVDCRQKPANRPPVKNQTSNLIFV